MTERSYPGIGLTIVLVVGMLFWAAVAEIVLYVVDYNQTNSLNPGPTCEALRSYGWDVEQSECVQGLLSE